MDDYRSKAGLKILEKEIFEFRKKDLELSFSSVCDKSCYYCYLKDYGEKLYPNVSKEQILKNLELLLDWLYLNDYSFNSLDIFSGEFFALSYWKDVFDILLNSKFKNYNGIMIPTNFSFVDKNLSDDIYDYKKKFEQQGLIFHLSCSIDGEDDYETRPCNNEKKVNVSKILEQVERFHAGLHPMVSPKFLKNYKKNADFWINTTLRFDDAPMLLEVRNNFWDKESLQNLVKFMYYFSDQLYKKVLGSNSLIFAKSFFLIDNEYKKYNCSLIEFPHILKRISCSFQSTVFVRVSDLTFIPCHRLGYPQFNYGHLSKTPDGLKYEEDNLDFHITATTYNPSSFLPKCSNCLIKSFCIKGCMGSQYENNKDPFIPIDCVCELEKIKYLTLHQIAKKYNLYEIILNDPLLSTYWEAQIRYVISILNELEQNNPEYLTLVKEGDCL